MQHSMRARVDKALSGTLVWDNHGALPLRAGDTRLLPQLARYRKARSPTSARCLGEISSRLLWGPGPGGFRAVPDLGTSRCDPCQQFSDGLSARFDQRRDVTAELGARRRVFIHRVSTNVTLERN